MSMDVNILIIIGVALYVVTAIMMYGAVFAHWQRRWPELAHEMRSGGIVIAFVYGVMWPLTFLVVIPVMWMINGRFPLRYGLKFMWRGEEEGQE